MKGLKYAIGGTKPKVHCKVFEDNSGALEMAKVHKFRPRTKHINIKYHHFRSYVNDDSISIHPITSANNPADMLTKGLGVNKLRTNRFRVLGWNVDTEKGCENNQNTTDVPDVSPSILSEQEELQASVKLRSPEVTNTLYEFSGTRSGFRTYRFIVILLFLL
jgi:hypothetical protein